MRGCELKGLRRKDVDLFEKTLTIRRDSTKTDAGARVIPLNRDAVAALSELLTRADQLGVIEPDHFVFPACECGVIDPTKPMKGWRTAWRHLTTKAGLKGLRFHDLRHQAITELCEAGLSDMTIMGIAGHVSREMLAHYSHIRLQAKRAGRRSSGNALGYAVKAYCRNRVIESELMGIRTSYSTNNSTKRFLGKNDNLEAIEKIGRGERIRTSDPLVPNQVLYQAEPRPVIA